MTNFLKKMFTGRMGRKEFLLPGLFFVMFPILLPGLLIILASAQVLSDSVSLPLMPLPALALTPFIVKRLHDIGLSGWFSVVLFLTMPTFTFPTSFLSGIDVKTYGSIVTFTLIILSLIHIISLLFLLFRGGKAENKYGAMSVYKKNRIRTLFWVIFLALLIIGYKVVVNIAVVAILFFLAGLVGPQEIMG